MNQRLVTVFGGTGYLGRHIVDRLIEDGARVRIAVRHPEAAVRSDLVEAVQADLRDAASVAAAVAGAQAVVNAVGLYVQRGGETFEAVHVEGARRVAEAAAAAGARRLILISGIGADPC